MKFGCLLVVIIYKKNNEIYLFFVYCNLIQNQHYEKIDCIIISCYHCNSICKL